MINVVTAPIKCCQRYYASMGLQMLVCKPDLDERRTAYGVDFRPNRVVRFLSTWPLTGRLEAD
jgi:hypothetical protein